jgi:uncharacterized tellurite resistance protein B-like protein
MTNLEQNLAKFQNLFLMAFADGRLDDSEKDNLNHYIEELGLTPAQCFSIIQSQETLNYIIPNDPADARKYLYELIAMMVADQQISELEYQSCLKFAKQAYIARKEVDKMIDDIRNKK